MVSQEANLTPSPEDPDTHRLLPQQIVERPVKTQQGVQHQTSRHVI